MESVLGGDSEDVFLFYVEMSIKHITMSGSLVSMRVWHIFSDLLLQLYRLKWSFTDNDYLIFDAGRLLNLYC